MLLISKFNTIEDVAKKVEERYNIKLPLEYKKFLDKYNGGMAYKTYVKINRKRDNIKAFFGYEGPNQAYNFSRLEKTGTLEEFLSKNLFPFASNSGGDFYVISLNDDNYGEVFIYYHDLLGKKKVIAASFSEFIKNCNSEEIGHVRTMEEREQSAIANGYGYKIEKLRPIWKKEIEYFNNLVQEEVILED